ncbi:sensor histidine kinase [Kutzneria sp. CA-103260]|uniref:sensor histidine kinase n=1 Tax=Kutzneria sp. CA-103260 TaxID=2802641 RepID=UPI002012C2B8|nr:histidine kinase [Kutzneria sp. CA-103260]
MVDGCTSARADGERAERRRRRGATAFASIFLVWSVSGLQALAQADAPVAMKAAQLAVTIAYLLSYPLGIWLSSTIGSRAKVWYVAVVTALGLATLGLDGPDFSSLLIYALALGAIMLTRRFAFVFAGCVTVVAFAVSLLTRNGPDWADLVLMVVLTIGISSFAKVGGDLREANREVARLAVAEERARVARDVHDVLGHSLTTVTLKLGLVRRLLETKPGEVERLIIEVGEAEQLSRQALSEVRATLSGYRSTSLSAEVAGARAALASAGITADLPRAVDNVLPEYQESFAYVLREGVTNVLRHSGATSCEVRLGESWLEVRDNGSAAGDAGMSRANGGGAGLTGLADRLAAIGGRIDAGPVPGGGFLLRASVARPVPV